MKFSKKNHQKCLLRLIGKKYFVKRLTTYSVAAFH